MVADAYNPSAWEAEVKGLQVEGHPCLKKNKRKGRMLTNMEGFLGCNDIRNEKQNKVYSNIYSIRLPKRKK
jgi:hypothetical protein